MKIILNNLKKRRSVQRKYFNEFAEEISTRNLQLMRSVCFAGIAIFCSYYIFTKIFFSEWSVSELYLFPVVVFGIILIISKRSLKGEVNVTKASAQVVFTYVFILAVTIVLSVFPNPDIPSIYYHLFILACPVLFILPVYVHMIMVVSSYLIFACLVFAFKTTSVWSHELFESFTALIFSMVVMELMSQFRVQTDSLKSKYYEMSQLDGLTHLMNKVSGVHAGEHYISQLKTDEKFAILFMDLDNFKNINDTYGHLMGDELLNRVAEVLRMSCRAIDIISRFGGDEYMVLLKNVKDVEIVKNRVNGIMKSINSIQIEEISNVTCSLGVYFVEEVNDMSIEMMIDKADEALYVAKQEGKNRYHIV